MATRLDVIAQQRAALAEERRRLSREAALERDRQARAARAAARAWQLTGAKLRNPVFIAYALADWDPEPAAKFLMAKAEQYHWPQRPVAEIVRLIEDAFMAFTESDAGRSELLGLIDLAAPADAVALRSALRYVEEWRVVMWARRQNSLKGLRPSSDLLLSYAERRRQELQASVDFPSCGTIAEGAGRKWVHRLRQRWGGRRGTFRVREVLSLDEMRDKVGFNLAGWRGRFPTPDPVSFFDGARVVL